MMHVAIMRKPWGLLEKIFTGEKTIESRWYNVKYRPWDAIFTGDTIYFKNSGEPVALKAEIGKVIQFTDLTPERVKEILVQYGKEDGIEEVRTQEFYERFKDKKYCILIFLKNPKRIAPFEIDKTGFGAMAAWITVSEIGEIKR